MALQHLLDSSSLRSLQILGGADSLLTDPTDTVLHAGESLLPNSLLDSVPLGGVEDTANGAVLDLHAVLEQLGHQNGLAGLIHGITDTGESLGLGKIGGDNLLSNLLGAPTGLASGDTSLLGHLVPNVTSVASALEGAANGVAGDAGANPGLLGPIGGATSVAQALGTQGLETLANDVVRDVHVALEGASDAAGVPDTVHGITNLGETIGLGKIGGDNLVTDVLNLPTSLLAGDLGPVANLPHDLSGIANATLGLVNGIENDLASGTFLNNPVVHLTSALPFLTGLPVTGLANEAVDTIHTTLEGALDPLLPGTIHGVTGIGEAIGLGNIGGDNLLTDVTNLPGAVLSGDLSPVSQLSGDVGAVVGAVGSALNGVGSDLSSGVLDSVTHPATGGGLLGGNLPGQGITGDLVHEVTSLGGTSGGVLAPVENVLHGGADGLVGSLAGGVGGLGSATGLLGGLTGGSGSGSHDLITVAAGPQTPTSGLALDVLSQGNGQTHLVDSHVGTAHAPVPTIATVGLLSGDSLHLPTLPGGGQDALSGVLGGIAGGPAPTSGGASAHAGIDLGVAHIDLPIAAAHADPFGALGVAAHHA